MNYGFQDVQLLNGNIGYIKTSAFFDPQRSGPTLTSAMTFVANTDALIVDLRKNSGGNPGMVALFASYFFRGDHRVHLNDLQYRNPGTRGYSVTEWWTLADIPGPRYLDKEVYILTSANTLSAAEELAYDLQTLTRATIVGERTWGGANPGTVILLKEPFQIFMPTGYAINPVTKTNWEGVGVKPDIQVPEQQALSAAEKRALQHLIAKTTDRENLSSLKQALASLTDSRGQASK